MNKKIEEMIALGVAYGVNCQPCMEYHKQKAIEAGLTKEEMQTAIQVAESVKTGAYNKTKHNAGSLFGNIKEAKCCPAGS
jgi:AhpD family alkylhydroperoxidase